jgi:hypothetical protein
VNEEPRGRGRPKLGVLAREVTLLPRHWEWLAAQPGGASVVLRKLVEQARKTSGDKEQIRKAQERAYHFILAIAGATCPALKRRPARCSQMTRKSSARSWPAGFGRWHASGR